MKSDGAPPPLFVRLEIDGEQTEVPVTEVGGTCRVAVGRVGHRSSIWRIWADKTSDVYVSSRTVAGFQKYSFHQSGDWRYAWVNNARALEFTGRSERVIDRWQRPAPDSNGWTRALSIWVRDQDVVDMPDDKTKADDVLWVEEPPAGKAVGFHLVFLRPDGPQVGFPGRLIDVLALPNGEAVFVLFTHADITPEKQAELASVRREGLRKLAAEDLPRGPGARMGVFGFDAEGCRHVWDTAWSIDADGP